jgi:hypothetical protein
VYKVVLRALCTPCACLAWIAGAILLKSCLEQDFFVKGYSEFVHFWQVMLGENLWFAKLSEICSWDQWMCGWCVVISNLHLHCVRDATLGVCCFELVFQLLAMPGASKALFHVATTLRTCKRIGHTRQAQVVWNILVETRLEARTAICAYFCDSDAKEVESLPRVRAWELHAASFVITRWSDGPLWDQETQGAEKKLEARYPICCVCEFWLQVLMNIAFRGFKHVLGF